MIKSKYIYKLRHGDSVYFLSGLSDKFFKTSAENTQKVEALLDSMEEHKELFPTFYDKMKRFNFLVDSTKEEEELLSAKYDASLEPHLFRIMVLPTYQCNLRCWYCTQEHEDYFMGEEIVARIKKLVDRVMEMPEITNVTLSWFGGEPLLCYDTVVDLCSYVKNACEESGKIFFSDMTTNGTLLDKERIAELTSLGIKTFQITIDGAKAVHDTVKRLPSESAFEKVMENIEAIAGTDASCMVRFNYTHKNLNPEAITNDLKSYLSEEARKKCSFMIYKVWQEDASLVKQEDVDNLFFKASDSGMYTRFATMGKCYADFQNFCCIYPNGKVSKCDNDNPKNLTSQLNEDGTITWSDQITKVPVIRPGDGSVCSSCRFFPVCWAPCFGHRQKPGYANECRFDEPYVEEILLNYCRSTEKASI